MVFDGDIELAKKLVNPAKKVINKGSSIAYEPFEKRGSQMRPSVYVDWNLTARSSIYAPGPTCSTRIISWSSWERMWQCQT